jgi:hypothetical protein
MWLKRRVADMFSGSVPGGADRLVLLVRVCVYIRA